MMRFFTKCVRIKIATYSSNKIVVTFNEGKKGPAVACSILNPLLYRMIDPEWAWGVGGVYLLK